MKENKRYMCKDLHLIISDHITYHLLNIYCQNSKFLLSNIKIKNKNCNIF